MSHDLGYRPLPKMYSITVCVEVTTRTATWPLAALALHASYGAGALWQHFRFLLPLGAYGQACWDWETGSAS